MNIFVEGFKNQDSTFGMSADGFHNFLLFAALKTVPKAACDPENCSESLPWVNAGEN
jgi:hypothetical protein